MKMKLIDKNAVIEHNAHIQQLSIWFHEHFTFLLVLLFFHFDLFVSGSYKIRFYYNSIVWINECALDIACRALQTGSCFIFYWNRCALRPTLHTFIILLSICKAENKTQMKTVSPLACAHKNVLYAGAGDWNHFPVVIPSRTYVTMLCMSRTKYERLQQNETRTVSSLNGYDMKEKMTAVSILPLFFKNFLLCCSFECLWFFFLCACI